MFLKCNTKFYIEIIAVFAKLNNLLRHDIEINLDNIATFLVIEESQDSLFINVLNNIDINEEIPMILEKSDLNVKEVEIAFLFISYDTPILILFEEFDDTQDNNSTKVRKNVEVIDVTSKLRSIIADLTDFRIEDVKMNLLH